MEKTLSLGRASQRESGGRSGASTRGRLLALFDMLSTRSSDADSGRGSPGLYSSSSRGMGKPSSVRFSMYLASLMAASAFLRSALSTSSLACSASTCCCIAASSAAIDAWTSLGVSLRKDGPSFFAFFSSSSVSYSRGAFFRCSSSIFRASS